MSFPVVAFRRFFGFRPAGGTKEIGRGLNQRSNLPGFWPAVCPFGFCQKGDASRTWPAGKAAEP